MNGERDGERRKPGIVVDCARQLEPNNRPPFLAKRLYCERQLTAEYAHAHSRCHDYPHAARTMNDTSDARIMPDTLLPHVSLARRDPGSCPSPVFP